MSYCTYLYNITYTFTLNRDNPKKAEMQTMDKNCLPVFKYFRPQRKSKILVHGFGDSAEDSLMFPLLRDGMYLYYLPYLDNSYRLYISISIIYVKKFKN